jgi:two-component system, NtrC family, nitrogen regulation sensor histidine kinase GlnL
VTAAADLARPAQPAHDCAGLDLLATGVVAVEADGHIGYANQAAEILLDTSRRHLVGQPAQRLFSDEHQLARLRQSAAAGDLGQLPHVVELRRPLREPVVVQVSASCRTWSSCAGRCASRWWCRSWRPRWTRRAGACCWR